jgi:uncharacterized membrane protein (DUF485 family)
MTTEEKIKAVKRKTRLRLIFTAITMVLYFSYVLSYTTMGSFLSDTLGESHVSGSLALYATLIVVFIIIELLFLYLNADKKTQGGEK